MKTEAKCVNIYNLTSTNMPGMPRLKGVATKIAFDILGTPDNLKDKKSKKQKEIDRDLMYENTQRVR